MEVNKQKEENYNEAINRAASDTDPNERPASDTGVDNDGYVELKEEEPEGYVEPIANDRPGTQPQVEP